MSEGTPTTQKPTRGELRSKIFQAKKLNSEIVEFRGVEVEVRQPTLGQILDTRDSQSSKDGTISVLIERVFVPGTHEHVFEEADREGMYGMPFDEDLMNLNRVVSRLAGINIEEAEEGLKKTTTASPSSP